jgi:hypothetical protein
MAFKKLYKHFDLSDIFEKKINCISIYNKKYIRSRIQSKKKIVLIDNNSFFFFTLTNKVGFNFYGNFFNFSHKKIPIIKFKSFFGFNVPNLNNISNNLLFLIKHLVKKKHFKVNKKTQSTFNKIALLILGPKRGGYYSYYLGLLGFVPFSHGVFAYKKLFKYFFSSNSLFFKYYSIYFEKVTKLFQNKFDLNSLIFKKSLLVDIFCFSSLKNLLINKSYYLNIFKFFFRVSSIKFKFSKKQKFKKYLGYGFARTIKNLNFVFLSKSKYKNIK